MIAGSLFGDVFGLSAIFGGERRDPGMCFSFDFTTITVAYSCFMLNEGKGA